MTKKKITVGILVLGMVFATTAFAELPVTVIGTFGLGYTTNDGRGAMASSFDLDLVSQKGFVISFGLLENFHFNSKTSISNNYIGIGWRNLNDNWDAGCLLVGIPGYWFGSKVNGRYWFTDIFGVDLSVMYGYNPYNRNSLFTVRTGISIRK